ncbi:MAG: hypothetical protein ACRDPY_29650 [Streptosporangiaceae bacterium]
MAVAAYRIGVSHEVAILATRSLVPAWEANSCTGVTEFGTPETYTPMSDPGSAGTAACAGSMADRACLLAAFPACAARMATWTGG